MHPSPDGPRFSSAPVSNVPDIAKLSMYEHPNYAQNPSNFHNQNGQKFKSNPIESPNPASLNVPQQRHILHKSQPIYHDTSNNSFPRGTVFPPPSSSAVVGNGMTSNVIWGSQGFPQPSEYVQGLIGVILLVLNTLKLEKIMPTEANISDCICYGDPKHRNTDVKKALDFAIEHHMVVKQNLGAVQLYVGKNERLWKCVNPIGGNPNHYPKATWDGIRNFLISSAGRSAIMASQCRYDAALILKKECLEDLALGDVLQILNMIITIKRWIIHHQLGWQPITISISDINTDIGTGIGA
ncbi:hypothetical protein L1049_005300 [Liquidambar formosana]|uniref:OST-HTH associated domain-containing protein n=1 Tax=Liquidambar formosana TaxID=63359 RepID=A0AAP0X1C8_LIQFO